MSGVNIFDRLLESGLPSREVQVALSEATSAAELQVATQNNHDNLNTNSNLQFAVDDEADPADVRPSNPLPVSRQGIARVATSLYSVTTDNQISVMGNTLVSNACFLERIIISPNLALLGGDNNYIFFCDEATNNDFDAHTAGAKIVLNFAALSDAVPRVIECGFPVANGITVYAAEPENTAKPLSNIAITVITDTLVART